MTLNEFKAWFEGFTENINGKVPTKAQWDRICKRIKQIDNNPVTPVYIERYWPRRYYDWGPYWVSGMQTGTTSTSGSLTAGTDYLVSNTTNLLANLGRADYSEVTNTTN